MDANPNLLAYEAKAIAVEIETLEKEKKDLEERLKRLELQNEQMGGDFPVKSKIEIFQIQGSLGEKEAHISRLRTEKEKKIEKVNRLEMAEKARQRDEEKAQKPKMQMYEKQAIEIEKQAEVERRQTQEKIELEEKRKKNEEFPKRVRIWEQEQNELPIQRATTSIDNVSIADSDDDISLNAISYHVSGRNRSSFRAISIRFKKESSQVKTISQRVETSYQGQTIVQVQQEDGRRGSTSTTATVTTARKCGNLCKHILGFLCIFIVTVICPPLAVLTIRGRGSDLCCNIILTLLGWIPGIVHAWCMICKGPKDDS